MATESDRAAFAPLVAAVARVAGPFTEAGFQLHLVGGAVRDALLGGPAGGDLDLTTDARPDQTLGLLRTLTEVVWTQGERFGTIGAEVDGRPYEITTHRTERYDPGSRKPEVAFADALEEDLARRDFTINAMAVAVPTGELVDPYGGRADLEARVLRTPLAAEVSFVDDPLRVLRAGRFVARFDLVAVDDVVAAAAEHAHRLDIVSVERILDELTKLLGLARPSSGLRFLADTGVIERVLPEADLSVRVDELAPDPALRLAALHRAAPVEVTSARMRSLRASRELTDSVAAYVRAWATMPADPDPPAVRRWIAGSEKCWREALDSAPVVATEGGPALAAAVIELESTEDLDDLSLPVDGSDVMAELGLAPGREVGRALARLREHRFEVGPMTRDQAIAQLHATP